MWGNPGNTLLFRRAARGRGFLLGLSQHRTPHIVSQHPREARKSISSTYVIPPLKDTVIGYFLC